VATNMEELNNLFAHSATDRVVKFRISGPGAYYYNETSSIIWKGDPNYDVVLDQKKVFDLNSLKFDSRPAQSAVDAVNRTYFPLPPLITIESDTEDTINVSGWAIDVQAKKTAAGVFVSID